MERKLNFGCGKYPSIGKEWDNADLNNADLNFNFDHFPYPIKDNTYDYIYSKDVLDHLKDFFGVMKELYRIAKPNAVIEIIVPFYNCQSSFMPTHYQHFGLQHFVGFTPEWRNSYTAELEEDYGKAVFDIIELKTIGIRWIPDIKIGKYVTLRYWLGMRIGEVVTNIKIKLRCIK